MNTDNSNELVVDDEVVSPSPLDPLIASLTLRTKTNNVTEGYDLSLSAFFGAERILLTGEDFSVEVDVSIAKAKIELDFIRCRPSALETNNEVFSDEWKIEQQLIGAHNKKRGVNMMLKAVVSNGLKGSGQAESDYESSKSNSAELKASRTIKNWQKVNKNTVVVGRGEGQLDGNEIYDFEGWKVIPDNSSEASGVRATLSVRENWINLIQIHSDSFMGSIGKKANDLLKTKDERSQQLFGFLLRHLAAKGLSKPNNPTEAILDVEYFVVRPDIENATSINSAPSTGSVFLDSTAIDEYLNSSPGAEVETLVSMGITHQDIREYTDKPKRKSGLFMGMSSPVAALDAYKIICKRKSMPRSELEKSVKGRTAQDLTNLALIKTKNNMLYLSSDHDRDPEDVFRYAAARAPTVMTTRAILVNDPSASNMDVAEMLITKFGKKYSTDASKIRVGNTLMRWARWLEPHLIDPNSVEGAKLKASALDKKYTLGPPSMATPENVAIVKAGLAAGDSIRNIAKKIGSSTQTITRWKKDGTLD